MGPIAHRRKGGVTSDRVTRHSRDLALQMDPRATRLSRDLALELKRVEAALKKAQASAEKLQKALADTKPRVTRLSRDLAKKRATRHSRDL